MREDSGRINDHVRLDQLVHFVRNENESHGTIQDPSIASKSRSMALTSAATTVNSLG
jgi:hypothetical protein